MMETATTLQSDLDRLNRESKGRSHTHNQSGSRHRMWSSSQRRVHSRSRHAWPIPKGDRKIGQGPEA